MNNNQKATKRALLTSVMALVMCVVMLVGTTFAWFTDTASTGVNKIQAGNLDVDIIGANSEAHLEKLNFTKAAGAEGEALLWEPGCRYLTQGFRIANKGNLALKWKAEINKDNIVDGKVVDTAKDGVSLLDVIDFYVVTKAADGTETAVAIEDFVGNLTKGAKSDVYYIKGVMQTSAGNDYQNLTLDGITITVYATQDTVENDSFGKTYDKDATYPVASAAEMKTALATGGIVSVNKDIKTDNIGNTEADRVTISKPTTLNLDAKIISPDNMGNNSINFCALIVDADTTINAGENGGIDTGVNGGYGINVRNGATLTINGGSYYGGGTAVQVQEGTLIINGGTFACEPFGDPYGYNFLINCIDSAYKNGTAKVEIKGGTFVNFDPSNCQAEGAGTNFVADGYKVVSATQTNGDTWYTVVSK
jgi:predicted ribosomally synthesized peptide with SipW-like signal peptide